MTIPTLNPLRSAVICEQVSERIDRFAETLPAFKAAVLSKTIAGFILEALDLASGADEASRFDLHMDAAQHAIDRLEASIPVLRAEIARARPVEVGG